MSGREKNCCWHFANASGRDEGPNSATEMQFSKERYTTLVREAIQNSLDAVLDESKPVTIKIEVRTLKKIEYMELFTLKRHIQGCIDYYGEKAVRFKPMLDYFGEGNLDYEMGYINVSDNNTKGMQYIENNPNCTFYAFALAQGVSVKEGDGSGGSFGFGKTAYFQISPIRTIFVSSRFHKNDKPAFLGITSLCTHKIDNQKKTAVGYYYNKYEGDELPVPVTNDEEIPVRFRRNEPGTSISIIGVDIDEKSRKAAKDEMVEAVLRNYWLAIWENKLQVDIDGIFIEKDNITEWMEKIFEDENDNSTWKNKYNPRPYFDAVRFTDTNREDCIKISDNLQNLGNVDLYVKINKDATDKIIYMRRNLMFIERANRRTHYGYNALFVCRGKCGDNILKELENPTHDKWDPRYRITKQNLNSNSLAGKLGKEVLNDIEAFVTEKTESIFRKENVDSLYITGLEDYLYIPEDLVSNEDIAPKTSFETSFGLPTDEKKDDGALPKAAIVNPAKVDKKEVKQVGHVIVTKGGTISPNKQSERIVGAGYKHGSHGPKPLKSRGSNDFVSADVAQNDDGTYWEYIQVSYRVIAQMRGNKIFHNIIFHSPSSTENGMVELIVGGEQTDEILQIRETSAGEIKGNFITGLHVREGKNIVSVCFNDNLKHAIILKAYESKK